MDRPQKRCSALVREISSHPLFSILTTFSLLILLYLPKLLPLLFSPVLISTLLLLSALLRFGSSPPETHQQILPTNDPINAKPETQMEFQQKTEFFDSLVEWGRRGGPLEVIYEEYEGEEEEGDSPEYSRSPEYSHMGSHRSEYFGFCSTDSDAESDDSLENVCFRWEEEEEEEGEEGEGMIEIALEEENLIEIDLSACR